MKVSDLWKHATAISVVSDVVGETPGALLVPSGTTKGKHGATRYVRVPAINSPHAHSVRCCSQTIYLGVTESRNDTTWPDTGWSQQNQQIPQPAAAKAAT
ncbi:hypothetical protein J6590_099121, partial [Homalodisca vitripennis]